MIRQRASSSRVPRGSTTRPPSSPSAMSTSGRTRRQLAREDVDERLLADTVDGVDRVALPRRRRSRTSRRATRARTPRPRRDGPLRAARGSGRASSWIRLGSGSASRRSRVRPSRSCRSRSPRCPLVVHVGQRAQLGGLLLRRRVAEEVAAADLRARRGTSAGSACAAADGTRCGSGSRGSRAVGRRLVQRHHVGKRHLPQVVEAHEHVLEHGGQVAPLAPWTAPRGSGASPSAPRRPRRRSARSTARTRSPMSFSARMRRPSACSAARMS